jgi:hypothetical protein
MPDREGFPPVGQTGKQGIRIQVGAEGRSITQVPAALDGRVKLAKDAQLGNHSPQWKHIFPGGSAHPLPVHILHQKYAILQAWLPQSLSDHKNPAGWGMLHPGWQIALPCHENGKPGRLCR